MIIVGNGFDFWQGIPTFYERFRQYYFDHIEEVAKELGCVFYLIKDKSGNIKNVTAVELIYGDPFTIDTKDSGYKFSDDCFDFISSVTRYGRK